MGLLDRLKGAFEEPEEESGDHDAPEHKGAEGHLKSWSAAGITEDELVDDDWIRRHTKEVD